MGEKYVVKGKDWSEASQEKRKYKVLQSYDDGQETEYPDQIRLMVKREMHMYIEHVKLDQNRQQI